MTTNSSFFLGSDNSMKEFKDIANQEIVTGMSDDFDLTSLTHEEDEVGSIRRLHKEDLMINYEMLRLNSIIIKNASLHGKMVAIKETEGLRDEEKSEEMMREMRIMSQLDHPNVIKFYGAIFEKSRNPQIVLELMDRNLFEILTKSRLSLYERMLLAREACKGMQYLEHKRIFHGDYKTENVLYDIASGSVKIADFGFSQKMNHVDNRVEVIRGTPWYLAPEVFMERRYGSYSDVYSFGISLVVHVAKTLPYDLEFLDTNNFLNRVAPPVMLRPVLPLNEIDCPASLKQLMRRCWHPDSRMRPSFTQILRELDNILVDCLFTNQSARNFWKHFFVVPNIGLLQEVSESHFADALYKCGFASHKVEEAKRVFSKDRSVNILHFEKYVDLFF